MGQKYFVIAIRHRRRSNLSKFHLNQLWDRFVSLAMTFSLTFETPSFYLD